MGRGGGEGEEQLNKPNMPDIRVLLRESLYGMTVTELHNKLPQVTPKSIRKALDKMPDAYIDRWRDPIRGQYQAVWCVVTPPAHCPYPTERFNKQPTPIKTRWVNIGANT
jgi:hypothetical protein